MNPDVEFIILEERSTDVQKKLNTWRHSYVINILVIEPRDTGYTYCALTRERVK